MGVSAALVLASYLPAFFRYPASLSRFLNLSAGPWPGLVGLAMGSAGGFSSEAMWGPLSDPAWARNDPTVNVAALVSHGTRLWVYCGNGTPNPGDGGNAGAGILESQALGSNIAFRDAYLAAGG